MTPYEWTTNGAQITSEAILSRVRATLEDEGPVVIEHRHYCGASAPTWFVCNDYDEFVEYLQLRTVPGDSFYLWSFMQCCRDDNALVTGKIPDSDGRTPVGGAY